MDLVINAPQAIFLEKSIQAVTPLTTQRDFLLNVLMQLGQDSTQTPLADLLRMSHKLPVGEWLIMSPIHWQATHNDAMIVAYNEALDLNESVARVWFAEVSQFLAQDGFELVYHSPYYWLLNVKGKQALTSPNLPAMNHRSLMPILAELDPTMYWQRLFTELQMFLSSHPLNDRKDQRLSINGLWFWGGGQLIQDAPQYNRPLISDSSMLQRVFEQQCVVLDKNTLSMNEETLVVIEKPTPEIIDHLVRMTRKNSVNWYWNDAAYRAVRKPWYKLWRK